MRDVKKDVKTKFLHGDILSKIREGYLPNEIRKFYGYSRQRMYYWIKKLLEADLISKIEGSYPAKYELTSKGNITCKKYIDSQQTSQIFKNPNVDLHNIQYKAELIQEGNLRPDKTKKLNTTIIKGVDLGNAWIEWNHKSITISLFNIRANRGYEAQDRASKQASDIIKVLREQYNFKIGSPSISRKPHIAIIHPIMKKISQETQIKTDRYMVDQSQSGEVEFFNEEDADTFIDSMLNLPKNMETLNEINNKIDAMMKAFSLMAKGLANTNEKTNIVTDEAYSTLKDIRDKFNLED